MDEYLPRVVDSEIHEGIETAGALVLRGARAVGKTESVRRVTASELRLDSADPRAALAHEQPQSALSGEVPRLVIVPSGIAHQRSDGVLVVPLSVLGP